VAPANHGCVVSGERVAGTSLPRAFHQQHQFTMQRALRTLPRLWDQPLQDPVGSAWERAAVATQEAMALLRQKNKRPSA
jgi:hypothetical protein